MAIRFKTWLIYSILIYLGSEPITENKQRATILSMTSIYFCVKRGQRNSIS